MDGKMIDAPVVGKAKKVVNRAEARECDVDAAKNAWKDQEPE